MPKSKDSPFLILFEGYYPPHSLAIDWDATPIELPPQLRTEIDILWQKDVEQTERNEYIFNGRLCRLNEARHKNGSLLLKLQRSDYKTHLFSNYLRKNGSTTSPHNGFVSRALGISVVIITADNLVLLMQRSSEVGEDPGKFDVIGGHVDPVGHLRNGLPDPVYGIKQEMEEEINLTLTDNENLNCIGLIETTVTKKPELVFQYTSTLFFNELKELANQKKSSEIATLINKKNDYHELEIFLEQNKKQISPSAFGCLTLHLHTLKS